MTEVTVTGNSLEDELNKMVKFSGEFNKKWRDTAFSIDYGNSRVSFSFSQNKWTSGYAHSLEELIKPYGYTYSVHPTSSAQMLISVSG